MTDQWEDIAYEMNLEDERVDELHKEWCLLYKEIKFDDSNKDTIKIKRIREIEFDIDSYFESRGEKISDEFKWIKTWSPLSKEKKLKLKEKQGDRPKDKYTEERKFRLRKRYHKLLNQIGHSINGEIDMFEKPNVVADYSLNLDTSDTTNYTFKFDERSTTIDTLFGNSYYIYVFTTLGENDYVARQFYNIEGWTYGSSYNLDSDYYSKTRMIKKLDNIEINLSP